MLGKTYTGQNCSVARTLELVGERWSLLIIRDALYAGCTRFGDFQRSLGIATNILTTRLESFVASGLMERHYTGDSGRVAEYVLTDKGRALQPVVLAMAEWGDEYAAPEGPPITFTHDTCGSEVTTHMNCAVCGPLEHPGIRALAGPGMPERELGKPVVPVPTVPAPVSPVD